MKITELFPASMFGIDEARLKEALEMQEQRRIFDYEVVNLDGERHLYREAVSFMVGGDDEDLGRTLWVFGNGQEDPDFVRAVYNEDEWRWIRPVEYVDDKMKDDEVNPLIDVSTPERQKVSQEDYEGDDIDGT